MELVVILKILKDAHREFLSALETGDKDKINECWAKLKDAHDELLSARNELIDAGNEINTQKHSSIENGQQR
jgi:hypothetical protein